MKHDAELRQLRSELDALDRKLLEVVRQRNDVVHRIAERKAAASTGALFDRERERQVYSQAERIATEIGLAPDIAREVMEVAVEASHRVQEAVLRRTVHASPGYEPRRFLIVGGAGQMGRRLAVDLTARGHNLDVLEPGDRRDRDTVIAAADIVIIAVPMQDAVRIAGSVAPFVRADALLCDINSLKSEICRVMHDRSSSEVLGLHPMFGPTVHSLRRQKVVVCPIRAASRAEWLRSELGKMGLEVIETDPETHDELMAIVQVLVHFSTLVIGEALLRTGVDIDESLRLTSPVYRLELAFVGRLFAQNPDLYAEIEMTNPHGAAIREHFLAAAQEMQQLTNRADREAFRKKFKEVAKWFHGFQDEAMQLSDRVIDAMVRLP